MALRHWVIGGLVTAALAGTAYYAHANPGFVSRLTSSTRELHYNGEIRRIDPRHTVVYMVCPVTMETDPNGNFLTAYDLKSDSHQDVPKNMPAGHVDYTSPTAVLTVADLVNGGPCRLVAQDPKRSIEP